jgi:PAS domain S-box-containing protein
MLTSLNILIVEDSPDDAELMLAQLRRHGFVPTWRRVETEPDFLAELKKMPDIILSDHTMPQFNGLRAAELAHNSGLDIPFILVSGTVGEEIAVEAMKCGATDYLLKDRVARLGNAVERALEQQMLRKQRQRAEEALRQSREEFKDLFDNAPVGFHEMDAGGRLVRINNTELKMLGYPAEELLGQFVWKISADEEMSRQATLAKLRGEAPPQEGFEQMLRRKDGTTFPVLINGRLIKQEGGAIIGIREAIQDITERKRVEDELRWRTAFFEAQVHSAPDGILVVDSRKRRILQNQRLIELFDVPREIVEDNDDAKLLRHATGQMKNPEHFLARVEHLYSHPDEIGRDEIELTNGTILDRYSSPVRDMAGKYFGRIWTFRDITARRKLEEQFRQSQKMEAFGQLAGGVAHDFNNILAVIQLQAGVLKAEPSLSLELLDLAGDIERAAERGANLTRQLLLFSRKQTMQASDLNLKDVVDNIMRMLKRTLGEQFQLQFKSSEEPLVVHADPGMIDQVLLNLTVNARDAMPKGGQIIIETSAVEFDDLMAMQTARARPGLFACLSVSDSGCGIPPEIMPRIFEPFFTTKEVGKGTGLGLATVFGIVQQHKGWINMHSKVARGTTFRVYLPRLIKTSDTKTIRNPQTPIRGGTETILLAEDESLLRATVRTALSRLGYHVLEAATGNEALAVWSRHRGEISLLLTDMVMPGGMTGKELAQKLLRQDPKLKVVYASGYNPEIAGENFLLETGVNFLIKPFEARKLAQIIRSRLDQH